MKSRSKWKIEDILFIIVALFTLVGILALGIGYFLSKNTRAALILVSSLAVITGYVFLISMVLIHRRRQAQAWGNLLKAASQVEHKENSAHHYLTDQSLACVARQVYSNLDYQVTRTEKHWKQGYYITVVSPSHDVELIKCLCSTLPVTKIQLCDLDNKMAAERAVRSAVWAPGGFSQSAVSLCSGKPVDLLNIIEIERLINRVNDKTRSPEAAVQP